MSQIRQPCLLESGGFLRQQLLYKEIVILRIVTSFREIVRGPFKGEVQQVRQG